MYLKSRDTLVLGQESVSITITNQRMEDLRHLDLGHNTRRDTSTELPVEGHLIVAPVYAQIGETGACGNLIKVAVQVLHSMGAIAGRRGGIVVRGCEEARVATVEIGRALKQLIVVLSREVLEPH